MTGLELINEIVDTINDNTEVLVQANGVVMQIERTTYDFDGKKMIIHAKPNQENEQ